jgi:hypothetical protein
MSLPLSTINIGTTPNDGTGDTVRAAFYTVNNNFSTVNTAVSSLQSNVVTAATILSLNLTGNLVANNVTANTNINATTITTTGNVAFNGAQVTHYDSIIDLHTYGNLAAWSNDDGKDIGLRLHYFNGVDSIAFVGLENSSKTLQFLINATEVTGNVTGTFGNAQMGSLLLSNTTASSSTATGALVVAGGVGVGGNVNIGGITTLSSAIQFANLTTTQVNAIASPTRGMTVYNYTSGNIQVYNGTKWANLTLS